MGGEGAQLGMFVLASVNLPMNEVYWYAYG